MNDPKATPLGVWPNPAQLPGQLEVHVAAGTARVEIQYPRCEGNTRRVEIGLTDVRAADSILVEYDFDRDGWSIKQASTFSWSVEEVEAGKDDPDWQEVAFVRAWARQQPRPWEDAEA